MSMIAVECTLALEARGALCRDWAALFGAMGTLVPVRALPLDADGVHGTLCQEWTILRPSVGEVPHGWRVLSIGKSGGIRHTWNVVMEQGGQLRHVWKVIHPALVAARSRDVQLPYASTTVNG